MKPKFEPTDDGLEIIDPIERHRYRLTMHESVDPTPVDTDQIQFPVDTAVEITTEMITLPTNESVYVRDVDGSMIDEVRPNKQVSLPHGVYTLDLSGPMKVYALVKSSVYIYSDSEKTYITLDEGTNTIVGSRSYHRRPAATITTTSKPTDVMKAVSTFGSALKSTTPERSYPTHRGHPAAIEIGDNLNIPEKIERPDTGIRIEIPPNLRHIFTISPLAYYLGAEITSGKEPRLMTENGFTHDLGDEDDFGSTVERVLKQIFFLDCIVRTEGITPLPLHERQEVEPKLELDIDSVYEQQLSKQIEEYLSIEFSEIEPHLPKWRLETCLSASAETIKFLPFIADNLAIVRIQEQEHQENLSVQKTAIDEFARGKLTRSTTKRGGPEDINTPSNQTDPLTIQQRWNSNDSSDITSTTPISAFQHSLGRTPREDPIEIEVVCNDSNMREEIEIVDGVYGVREELPFDITFHHNITTERLSDVLEKNIDFFHFIGHIDEQGFECIDGKLNASSLENIGVKAFFLNACQSYAQGLNLVEAGSIGGIVTYNDIINSGAVKVGYEIARLLNQGFPLYAALDVVRKDNIIGQQYFVVGDGMVTIAQSETGPPFVCSITSDKKGLNVYIDTYTTTGLQKGSLCIPYLEENNTHFLTASELGPFHSTKSQLLDFFEMEDFPVIIDESLNWSDELTPDEL